MQLTSVLSYVASAAVSASVAVLPGADVQWWAPAGWLSSCSPLLVIARKRPSRPPHSSGRRRSPGPLSHIRESRSAPSCTYC